MILCKGRRFGLVDTDHGLVITVGNERERVPSGQPSVGPLSSASYSWAATHHVLIYLISNYRHELGPGHFQDSCQVLTAVYRPARVRRIVDDDGRR